ncbi:MAG: DUF499 domain-containing protein [Anaerolineae bacterium]
MALSNRERVGRILESLREGLLPFIVREYKSTFGDRALIEMDDALGTPGHPGLPEEAWTDPAALSEVLDTHACLHLMWRRWNEVFQDKLGHVARSYVSEMIEARNNWAHDGAFTVDQAYRVADTATRLLKAVSAAEEAEAVEEIAGDLLRIRFERESEQARREAAAERPESPTTLTGLKGWRDVVEPHPDVATGRYIQAEFAADLAQVHARTAATEYQDPKEFFRRTYLTEGLQRLLVTGVKRLTAQGGEPVVQLQTSFGGGKTHSMLALYHLCSGEIRLSDIPDSDRLVADLGDVDLPEARCAVLVGTALDPTRPREYAECTVRTLWGELAYQLGGVDGYQMVEEADRASVSPGSDTLSELFFRFGPALIMIDELVAYARNLYGAERLPGGTFDTIMSFMQSLTEAVKRSPEALLLISLPESDIEIGGEAGKRTLEILSNIVGRIEAVWKPITPNESFEIVRRRLFSSSVDRAARDAVVEAFADMYRNTTGEFPGGVGERDYLERMRGAYPIHPELFDRLYQDWSTLERFQRTRGVLRLMAAVIHQLWIRGDGSLMIMPGTLPLDTTPVRNELLRYLPDTWAAVLDTDIDGPDSRPFHLDQDVPALGRFHAARRVARTVFIGSAPSVAAQQVRGQEEVRIRLGCAQPGEPAAVFGDALRRLSVQLTYLYTDSTRYWYDTRPTVNKLARDRAQGFRKARVDAEIVARLRAVPKTRDFAGVHVAPPESADVVDEDRVRVVVLGPDATHRRTTATTPALERAHHILERRGSAQRLYKNMLVFIAPDEGDAEALRAAVREFLAWQSIEDETEQLNLDAQQRRQVGTSVDKADDTVDLRVRGTYSWLLVPMQPEPLGPIELQASRISGDDNFYQRAARRLHNDGLLIEHWSPDILRMELDRYIWSEERGWEVGLKQLWEYLAQYVYLPRLRDHDVLLDAVQDGVGRLDPAFAYATGKDAEGYHTGVLFQDTGGSIYFDERSLLIHPDHVRRKPAPEPTHVGNGNGGEELEGGDGEGEPEPTPPPAKKTVRYYGRVTIDPQRVNREVGLIVEEVVQRLTSQLGTDVEITLEIKARKPEGFEPQTIRTISENSRTLKFDEFGFSEG